MENAAAMIRFMSIADGSMAPFADARLTISSAVLAANGVAAERPVTSIGAVSRNFPFSAGICLRQRSAAPPVCHRQNDSSLPIFAAQPTCNRL
jgi:hypothetical protein